MGNYYFLATALPPLEMGTAPEMPFSYLQELMRTGLNGRDLEQVAVIRRFYDLQNIRALWKHEPCDLRGNFDQAELQEMLVGREGLPDYVDDFTTRYESTADRLRYFPALLATFFKKEIGQAHGFLKQYLTFEYEWRLVLTGFRAKQLGRDIAVELQFEDPNEDLVAQLLAQKDAKTYIPPDRYQELLPLFEEHHKAPLELYQALCEYRFHKIDEMLGVDLFSIDRILGYMAQLITVEKWLELDKHKGMEVVDKAIKEPYE
jgi:hypothetical protein